MKENKLPNYVLRRNYNNLFLFLDSEIYNQEDFNSCIQDFSNKVGGTQITIEIMNFNLFEEYKDYCFIRIPNVDKKSLSKLSDIQLIDDQSVLDLMGDYYIYDDTNSWEFYVDLFEEMAVFGCNNILKDKFNNIFKPYEKISFMKKIESISFGRNKQDCDFFISELFKNYNWGK